MIETKDLMLLRYVAEFGSITRAARKSHITQSAVSQRLSKLQDRVGTALFKRRNGTMQITRAGQRLLEASKVVESELLAATEFIQNLQEEEQHRLRITTQCYTCYRWLPFVLRDLRKAIPQLQVDVVPTATDTPYTALQNNDIDVAIVSNPSIAPEFAELELFDDELFAVMHSAHDYAGRSYLNPENFSDQTLILYTGKKHAILNDVLYPASVKPAQVIQVRITEAIVELARSGQGIAILSGWAFSDLDNNAGLTAVRITRGGFKRSWRAVVGNHCAMEYVDALVGSVRQIGSTINHDAWRKVLQADA